MKRTLLAVALAAAALPALAQHTHVHGGQAPLSPYAGMQDRAIKALSPQQLDELRVGKGMGYAMPAELNGYPGPAHTLELAGPLGLSESQRRETQALFDEMQAEAIAAGKAVIASETALDRLFSSGTAEPESVRSATAEAARAHGELRAVHLRYHLRMRELLTPAQTAKYAELRGYL